MPDQNTTDTKHPDWSILTLLNWTQAYFDSYDIDSPRLTAEILLAHSLKIKRLDLYLQHDRPLEQRELDAFKQLIKRRVKKEPVAYITGQKGFYESEFAVTPDVLIPRPDTEILVEKALDVLTSSQSSAAPKKVLELGTGSGAIVTSLAKKAPQHLYMATDVSLPALNVARQNVQAVCPGSVMFCAGSWFDMFSQAAGFDLVISNPPYIPTTDIDTLQDEIRSFEPRRALDGGPDGLDCYREILSHARKYLALGGWLMLEIGYDQRTGIAAFLKEISGYGKPEIIKDLAGNDRVVAVKKHR